MKLNCDLGESFGPWQMGRDEQVMPLIDQANIACGMHASDPLTMLNTVKLAQRYDVEIGAHPGYPDKEGFGRRAMALDSDEVYALVLYQVAALDGVARTVNAEVGYVKPHGALYHAMMNNARTREAILRAVADFPRDLALVMLANADYQQLRAEAANFGVNVRFEAFADRAYAENGALLARDQPGAVHQDQALVLEQAQLIARRGQVKTLAGKLLSLPADTLCVHGDNDHAVQAVAAIRQALTDAS